MVTLVLMVEPKLELSKPVEDYIRKKVVTIDQRKNVTLAATIMQENGFGSLIVVNKDDEPVGIITERDILYKAVAAKKDPALTPVESIMSSPVQTISSTAKVGDAIAKMARLGIRRLAVTKGGKFVGLLSQRSIISDVTEEQILLPELEKPKKQRCPYCDQQVKDVEELSKHIDQIHIGKGLLEGDVRRW